MKSRNGPTRVVCTVLVMCAATGNSLLRAESAAPPPAESTAWPGYVVVAQVLAPVDPAAVVPAGTTTATVPATGRWASAPPAIDQAALVMPPPPSVRPDGVTLPQEEEAPPPPPSPPVRRAPLLGDAATSETLMPYVIDGEMCGPRGVRPYGGGHPSDWWGCGGSPYRTGPGLCDNWKVGGRWHVTADGWVLARPRADLDALVDQMFDNDPSGMVGTPRTEQFDYAPGGRIAFISQVPRYVGYQVQAVYEGIEEWNASIVFPKIPGAVLDADGIPIPDSSEQRSLHYRSNLHSGELNWVREWDPALRPFCGVRYVRFNEKINDWVNQETPSPPLPVFLPPGEDPDPVITTDRLNAFDIDNQLLGFQIGAMYDLIHLNERFSLVGYVNTGLYYNRIKYANLMGVYTTQQFPDNLSDPDVNQARTDFSDAATHDVSRHSEIATVSEASLTAVFRLNPCWALRSGYQALWINNVHVAQDAFLFGETNGRGRFFHGWHAGIEHRR